MSAGEQVSRGQNSRMWQKRGELTHVRWIGCVSKVKDPQTYQYLVISVLLKDMDFGVSLLFKHTGCICFFLSLALDMIENHHDNRTVDSFLGGTLPYGLLVGCHLMIFNLMMMETN